MKFKSVIKSVCITAAAAVLSSFVNSSGVHIFDSLNASAWADGNWNYAYVPMSGPDTGITNSYGISIISYYGSEAEVTTPEIVYDPPQLTIPTPISELPVILIDKYAFMGNTDIECVNISEGIESIYASAFADCTSLKSVTFPSTLSGIGDSSFINTALTSVDIPENVSEIKNEAFKGCSELTEAVLSDGLTIIGQESFSGTGLTSIVIPESVTTIQSGAFSDCEQLESVTILGDTQIKNGAFKNCSSLSNLTIKGVSTLENDAFYNCEALYNVNIDTASDVSDDAFRKCGNFQFINGKKVVCVDPTTGDTYFCPEYDEFIRKNFIEAIDVGFINTYIENKVKSIVSQITDDNMTDMEKIKAIHDWVCGNVVYDNDTPNAVKNHIDSSIFLNDSTVCDGYARGYDLLLQAAGIESYCVHNSGIHVWNIVKIGNHYFHSDCTWDDTADSWNYNWFLKSDMELTESDNAHSAWTLFIPSDLHNYVLSTMPTCDYQIGDINMDGKIDSSDVKVFSGHLVGKNNIESGDTVLADLNYDGSVDSLDMVEMRKLCSSE